MSASSGNKRRNLALVLGAVSALTFGGLYGVIAQRNDGPSAAIATVGADAGTTQLSNARDDDDEYEENEDEHEEDEDDDEDEHEEDDDHDEDEHEEDDDDDGGVNVTSGRQSAPQADTNSRAS
jgi:hypothetical protein